MSRCAQALNLRSFHAASGHGPSACRCGLHLLVRVVTAVWIDALHVQTGVLEYPKEDSMTTMQRVRRFLQRKDGRPESPAATTPQIRTPKQTRARV